MKIKHITDQSSNHYGYKFMCPGCKDTHAIPTKPADKGWDFDGNVESPTFSPSILVYGHKDEEGKMIYPRCHSFVRAGKIEFLGDCEHELAGHTVELPELE